MRMLGRAEELSALGAWLDARTGGGGFGAAIILGEPGIGKTVLWDEVRRSAVERGCTVLTARPVEHEATLGFAALGDLFGDVTADVVEQLPRPQREALRVALLHTSAPGGSAEPRALSSAALAVLRTLTRRGPVVLAVDDLPWLDADSARVLAFALRRLGPEPIGLLTTARGGAGSDFTSSVVDVLDPARVTRVCTGPLSIGAVRELLDARLAFAPSHRLLTRLYAASAGNPYFALELARAVDPEAQFDLLAVPPSLRRLLRTRVAGAPAEVREYLLTAALAQDDSREVVAAAAPDPAQAHVYLEAAATAGLIDLRADRVRFTHPLLRSVLVEDATPAQRRSVHLRLADHVPTGAQRAWHRAHSAPGPAEAVAAELDAAAAGARHRGATETAAELAELAVRMTPGQAAAAARRRSLLAAQFRFESGDPGRARTLLAAVAAADQPGPARAAALIQLSRYERYCGESRARWTATLASALDDAGPDERLRLDIHNGLGFAEALGGDAPAARVHAQAVSDLADALGNRALDAHAAAAIAYIKLATGEGLRADLAELALAGPRGPDPVPAEETPTFTVAYTFAQAGELAAARALLTVDLRAAAERGDETSVPMLSWLLTRIETWAGDWAAADRHAEDGMRAAELADNPFGIALMAGSRAVLRAGQGATDDARADAARAAELADQVELAVPAQLAAEALGTLYLSLGDPAAARAALAPVCAPLAVDGVAEARMLRFVPLQVEALARMRELDEAEALLDSFAVSAARFAPTWASAAADRCRGLLLAAHGELASAQLSIDAALECAAEVGEPFEHAQTLHIAGEIRRRARKPRRARDAFAAARELFAELGASLCAARCEAELDRLGARAQLTASDALTPAERVVAALAAEGRTTREIAATTFTGVRTVEAQLHSIYRKLAVRSRVELSRKLASPTSDLSPLR